LSVAARDAMFRPEMIEDGLLMNNFGGIASMFDPFERGARPAVAPASEGCGPSSPALS
jgi:hypothetical protein